MASEPSVRSVVLKPGSSRGKGAWVNVVYELRQRAGLTQALLARFTGIPQSTISRYETGLSSPRLETLEALAEAVGFLIEVTIRPKES